MSYRTIGLIVCLAVNPALAVDLHVAANGDDAASGLSWTDPLRTIAEANLRAAAAPGIDIIKVAPGRYVENITLAPSTTLFGSVDPVSGASDPDRWPSILDGSMSGPVVVCDPLSSDSILEGFVITRGFNTNHGGGISCSLASPVVRNNRIIANMTDRDGGGMSAADNSPVIEDNLFFANIAADDAGGLRLARSAATVRGNSFVGNAAAADGGGLRLRDTTGTVILEDNIFADNTADENGGGLSVVAGDVQASRNRYENNFALLDGGAASYRDCPSLDLDWEVFLRNEATGHGGAVALRNCSGQLINSLARRNTAGRNGGALRSRLGGPLTIANSVFSRNQAGLSGDGRGGGLAIEGLIASLRNLAIVRNVSTGGGGLFVDTVVDVTTVPANATVASTTLFKNDVPTGPSAGAHVGGGSFLTMVNSIAWQNSGSLDIGGSGSITVSYCDIEDPMVGVGVFSLDPLFAGKGQLSDRWGIEQIYLSELGAGELMTSPCVEAGDQPSTALALDTATTRTDDVTDVSMVDLGFHPSVSAGFTGQDIYRAAAAGTVGRLYLTGAAPGVLDPEPVLTDLTRPLLFYRGRGISRLTITKSGSTVSLGF